MVSCGQEHTLVLTAVGVWSCGWGDFCQLGHGDSADKLVLTLVGAEGFRRVQIDMVAVGGAHSVALGADGRVWTWGNGRFWQPWASCGGHTLVLTAMGLVWGCAE